MNKAISGIHHISAIVGHPQENTDFYAGVLGLRLVKKTVNFDDPGTYHLYFGNQEGSPGTIITFFPWENARQGQIGTGQVGVTSYAVPTGALPFWENRLSTFNIPYTKDEKFGEEYLAFDDVHGLHLEIVERKEGPPSQWTHEDITPEVAIKGFAGATLYSRQPEKTAALLEDLMGLVLVGRDEDLYRYQSSASIGNRIDIQTSPMPRGRMGVGTVHHIAWRAADDAEQLDWQAFLREEGYGVTPVQDRNYFNAIYFREKGEILFEIATDPPGFAIDEPQKSLGEKLMLPPQYEDRRQEMVDKLTPVEVRAVQPQDSGLEAQPDQRELTQSILKQINELSRKEKAKGLSPTEKNKQTALRQKYVELFRGAFNDVLLNSTVIDPLGQDVTPDALKKAQRKKDQNKQSD